LIWVSAWERLGEGTWLGQEKEKGEKRRERVKIEIISFLDIGGGYG